MKSIKNIPMINRQRSALWFGMAAGIIYATFAWGIDGFLLFKANASLPWLKLSLALLPVPLMFGLASWLGAKAGNLITRTLLWISTACILCLLVSILTFQVYGEIVKLVYPQLGSRISYIVPEGIHGRLFVILVMTNILFIIGGMLFESASEAMISASGVISWLVPVGLCFAFFAGAGYVADSNFNTELRDQVISVNEQIEEVSLLNLSSLSEYEQRMVRRFTKLDVNLAGPRKLLVGSFDNSFSQVNILVDFDGNWANCLVMNGRVGNCEMVEYSNP
jgi:hypothetical protein